ncbi:thiamine pyrophosphate-binding protein [Herbiconiux sp.]|uniref:thiamine pyrophosphate-binding protein n=1 Tax=Herbiconiux sp. TaxID=1871186 RepID=UPI0025B8B762|nr:thiamine pyrophosphate-binding protein [Herbiconiux sp.]
MSAGVASAGAVTATVMEQLAQVMVDEGCKHLFTLMGAGNLWLIHHLDVQHGLPVHHLRHENGAIGAADGYARATGRLGWATVTQGPGFTNTITALLTASRGRTPMILIVTDTSNLDPQRFPFAGGVQALAPEVLLDPLGIESVRASGADAGAVLRAAAQRARAESRTIVFVMPAGLDRLEADPLPDATDLATLEAPDAASAVTAVDPAPVDPAQISAAVDALEGCSAPVLLAGRGVVEADAASEVLRLAELLGARVATSVPASGVLGEHPAVIGPFGGFSIGETERIIAGSDGLVVIGASLNLFQTRKGEFTQGRTIVRVDLDPAVVEGAVTVPVRGDARSAAAALADEVARRAAGRASAPDSDAAGASRIPLPAFPLPAIPLPTIDDADRSEPGRIDPRALAIEFERVLPRERRVFIDNGHFGAFPVLYLSYTAPRSLIWMPDFGAVGSSLAASYASAVADPGTQSVLFIGDCGLYLTLGDLETAVRERVPLLVVCMNDGAAGSELAHMKDWGVPPEQAIFGYADLAALAIGMGAQGALIAETGDLAPALAAWDRTRGPLLLDCHISRAVRSPIYDHV